MRTFGHDRPHAAFGSADFGLGKGPFEPRRERFEVAAFDRRPAPDAQSRRGVAVIGDVVGDAFFLEQAGQRLCKGGLIIGRQARDRRIDDFQANRRVRAERCIIRKVLDPRRRATQSDKDLGIGIGSSDGRRQAADRFRPLQRVQIILDAQHRRRVDGLAGEDPLVELAALGEPENLRQAARPVCSVSSRSTARGDKMSIPCAPSPPSAFCQENVATSSLGQSRRCANAADVASQIVIGCGIVEAPDVSRKQASCSSERT